MISKLDLSTVIVILASCIVTGSLEDSCQDLESIEPCDTGSLLDVTELGSCGNRVIPERASSAPSVIFTEAEGDEKYVLVMVDPDAPSAAKPKFRYWRHWVMSDISGSALQSGSLDGKTWTDYNGPSPPAGSGPHRYQFFLFQQSGSLQSVASLGNSNRGKWDLRDFVRHNQLCDSLVASYEFITENK